MTIIYEPRGKAREYSPLALNLYLGCTHKCKYCYAPSCMLKKRDTYFHAPEPRKNVLKMLSNEVSKHAPKEQVLMSFIGDVYSENSDGNSTTRSALEILRNANVPVAILTKGGERCLKDIDMFKRFGDKIQIGATLTFDNDADSLEWESGAASPQERLGTLRELHKQGIRTFASFEPVIDPDQSIELIEKGLDCIDVFKIGKLNNYKQIDKAIDWTRFLIKVVEILREAGKQFYIKHDLQKAAASVKLFGNEMIPDMHNVK